jgi:hypothetical protein
MNTLVDLQHAFQRALLERDRADIVACIAGENPRALTSRLAIYEHAYAARLHAALESNYPLLASWVGKDAFARIARDYVGAHPSEHFSIRSFGDTLSSWLAHYFDGLPWIAEFAHWEWTLGACFDGPDCEPLEPQALGNVSAHEWPSLRFAMHPSATLFTARTNAPLIYKALADESEPPEPAAIEPCHWLVWRTCFTPSYRSLDSDEHAALEALRNGAAFEKLCTIIDEHQVQDTASRAASLLREWLNARLLCAVHTNHRDALHTFERAHSDDCEP